MKLGLHEETPLTKEKGEEQLGKVRKRMRKNVIMKAIVRKIDLKKVVDSMKAMLAGSTLHTRTGVYTMCHER